MIAKINLIKGLFTYVPETPAHEYVATMVFDRMITKDNIGKFLVLAHKARIDVQIVEGMRS